MADRQRGANTIRSQAPVSVYGHPPLDADDGAPAIDKWALAIGQEDVAPGWATDEISTFITSDELVIRTNELAWAIAEDYRGLGVSHERPLHMIGVLKGVVPFMADLMRAIPGDVPVSVDFLSIASYGPETRHNSGVRLIKDLDQPVVGRHVLLVEDIIDTGLTLGYLMRMLRGRQPASLRVCTLLDRTSVRLIDVPLAYVGFEIPDHFVVGYGLDYKERYRNLPYVGVLVKSPFESNANR